MKGHRFFLKLSVILILMAMTAGTTLAAPLHGSGPGVFVNEIHYDNSGADTGEAVEVAGAAGTDLTGWTLALYNGSASQLNVYDTITLSGVLPDEGNGCGTLSFERAGIQNGAPDGLALVDAGNSVVQFLSYEGVFTATSGPAAGMTSTDIGVSEDPAPPAGNSLQLTGTGSTYDDFAWASASTSTFGSTNSGQTFSGCSPVTPPPPATDFVVINEVDSDTPGTDALEFIELYDGGVGNTDLSGLVVVLYNGSDDQSYNSAFDLDGYSTDGSGYFLLGNAGVSPTPDIIFGGNGLQNGADAVALYIGDGADFPNDTAISFDGLLDAVVYDTNDSDDAGLLVLLNAGQPQLNEDGAGDSANHSNQRCPNGGGGQRNTADWVQAAPTPGADNACDTGNPIPAFGVCGDSATAIHDVQGNGAASPLAGSSGIIVEGVVVGDFQGSSGLRGFFVQEQDFDTDADPLTSEGVFIYDDTFGTDVNVGDVVRVQGDVTEYYGLTEIDNVINVVVCGSGVAVTPATITLPVTSLDVWEHSEGMLVTIPQELTVTDNYTWGRYGEVELSGSGRQYTPTNATSPGALAVALQDLNNRNRIQLDDTSTFQNPLPLPPYIGLDNTLRDGDTIPSLIGVLSYSFDAYEIQPVGPISFTRVNERQSAPSTVGGDIRVAAVNVLNFFTTLDNGTPICGPTGGQDCRGADTADEFTRQRDKIVNELLALDADVVGLMEIENNSAASIQNLVDGLNDIAGPGTYAYINTGTVGTDAIKVAILYQPAHVTPVGAYAILDSSIDPAFIDTKNRPSLAQTFEANARNERFTVVVNHLKSKGSACDDVGDPDTGDGQGNCNQTRTAAAIALTNWLATDPTGSGDPDFLIIGDLNSYAMEDPITAIKNAGYTSLIESFVGPDAYSYVFEGQSGYLDHALASSSLAGQIAGATEWHINADEPVALDYNNYNQPALYTTEPYRASDHDPVLVGLALNSAPVCIAAYPSADILWPANHKYVTINVLGITDANGDPLQITITNIFQDEPVVSSGSGNTAPDGQGVGTGSASVRAEREGSGNGRFYHIGFTADDGRGGTCSGVVLVNVPKSQSNKDTPVDDGPLYDSTVTP